MWQCDNCGYTDEDGTTFEKEVSEENPDEVIRYCPECGSDEVYMIDEEDDEELFEDEEEDEDEEDDDDDDDDDDDEDWDDSDDDYDEDEDEEEEEEEEEW